LKDQQSVICPGPVIATPTPEPPTPKHTKVIEEPVEKPVTQPKPVKPSHEIPAYHPPPPKPKIHSAVREEQPSPPPRHHRAGRPPVRRVRAESAPPKLHRPARVWQPPAFVGSSAPSHGSSPTPTGVGY